MIVMIVYLSAASPSRVQSSPGSRSGAVIDTPSAPHRPQTAASTLTSSTASSTQPSVTPSLTGGANSSATVNPPAAVTMDATPAAGAQMPRIQLADLQNILSGLDGM